MKNLFMKQKEDKDSEEQEELLPEEVTAVLKVIRKFAQKYWTENDVLSLRKISGNKMKTFKQTPITNFIL